MNIYEEVKKINSNNGNKIALRIRNDDGQFRTVTYKQMFERVHQYASQLVEIGIVEGDRIAIIAENSPEWDIAYLSIVKINATAVLIDASLPKEDIIKLLEKSDVRTVYASVKVMQKLNVCPVDRVPVLNIANGDYFEGSSMKISPMMERTTDGNPEIANIIFSSGTTKTASGIMHSHDAMIESTRNCIENNKLTKDARCLSIIPNSHIYGMVCLVLGPLLLGAEVCFIETMSGEIVAKVFHEYHPTILPAVPKVYDLFRLQILQKIAANKLTDTMYKVCFPMCLAVRKKTGINLGKRVFSSIHKGFGGAIKILCSAGAPMSEEVAEFYYGTGFDLLLTYGATETNIPTIGNRGKNITTNTSGTPYPNVEVKLSKDGEILIKSPYMMKGYFREEEATRSAFVDGWFKSGDMGQIDNQGNLKIVGRCKENIVLATGKKVAPDDIESGYSDIQGIKELVVCGVPNQRGDYDESHAFVIVENLRSDLHIVRERIMERSASLSANMKLAKVHFVEDIAKTSLQKPKRYLLKQVALRKREQEDREEVLTTKEPMTMEEQVKHMVAMIAEIELENVTEKTKLFTELGMDSLSSITLGIEVEAKFGVCIDDVLHKEMDVQELIAYIKQPGQVDSVIETVEYPQMKRTSDYLTFTAIRHLARIVFRIRVKNEQVIPDNTGYILCANHVSNFDFLYLTIHYNRKRFNQFACMAKKELFNGSRTSKKLARVCGMVPVDRSGANVKGMQALKERLREHWGVLIHPEGTRSMDGSLGTLKQGAATLSIETQIPIIPAYIKGGYEIYPRGKKMPNLFNWKKIRRYQVEVIYGDPITPEGHTAEELTRKLEKTLNKLENQV